MTWVYVDQLESFIKYALKPHKLERDSKFTQYNHEYFSKTLYASLLHAFQCGLLSFYDQPADFSVLNMIMYLYSVNIVQPKYFL